MSQFDHTDDTEHTRYQGERGMYSALCAEVQHGPPVRINPLPVEAALFKKLVLHHTWQ